MGTTLLTTGDIAAAREHLDQAILLYDPAEHLRLATQFGVDARVAILSFVPVKITGVNEVTVAFYGSARVVTSDWTMRGSIDRVTGDVDANQTLTDPKTAKTISSTAYSLKCKPTQRMF
jgi:hypothetical protein